MSKVLNTKDNVLDKKELIDYLARLASDNVITKMPEKSSYPISVVKENCEYIYLVYTLLNDHVKMGLQIHPAGEWILDNYYIIEKACKTILKELTREKYMKFPGLQKEGFARIYVLANEIVSNTDGKIREQDLIEYLESYQTQKELEMEEIWNIGLFLQISIIQKIRQICEKIFISQMQKFKVDNIVERLIEEKPSKEIKLNVEGTYPFIEYMSYKLKKYGKKANPYLEVFEEQVEKMGITVTDAINREHFDMAVKSLSMKNSITSLKTVSRIDIVKVFKTTNVVEKILKKDPANVYDKMDYATKDYYRQKIREISNKTKISEIFIAEQVLKLAQNYNIQNLNTENDTQVNNNISSNELAKESHIGYYLIDEGLSKLLSILQRKKVKIMSNDEKAKFYIAIIYVTSIIITLFLCLPMKYLAILLFIPIQNVVTQIVQYILSKKVKTRIIPKIDLQSNIPKESATMCIIPTVIKNKKDVEKITKKMEVYYLANKSENLYFTLLGDCTNEQNEAVKFDKEIEEEGKKQVKKLNEKYGEKFFFAYRKREWSNTERCYMGWERKRGMIAQFNEFLKTGRSQFKVNTCKKKLKIKYVITIDEDTNLTLNSVFNLVGAMSHILNKPEVDKIKNIVVKGHGIITPRIGLDLNSGRKSTFSRLFAGNGGIDLYTNAISDVYQDNFDEGIFTGKGIYDLDVFYDVLKDSIPENTVLSHDLIEGSYLRCGLASDIILIDSYPSNYISYKTRKHRWIRGDIQVLKWLNSELNDLSKYKIIDNIVRNLNEACIFITLVLAIIFIKNLWQVMIPIIILAMPLIMKLLDNFVHQKGGTMKHRLFASKFSKWSHTIYKFLVDFITLPDIAILEIDASLKALYRMKISHNFLLEWTTANDAENKTKNNLRNYIISMKWQIIISLLLILLTIFNSQYSITLLDSPLENLNLMTIFIMSMLCSFLFAFCIMWALGKEIKSKINLEKEEKNYLMSIAKMTWSYFKDNLVNSLPPDNYQEDRKEKCALRTSPTNIGLAMLSIIASFDLKFENKKDTIKLLSDMIETVIGLPKWNGHLYNWYDIKNLKPILPLDISSVDSGNFVGYLYTVREFLAEQLNEKTINDEKGQGGKQTDNSIELIKEIDTLIKETDFSKLYDYEVGLFSIGFNCEQNKLYDSYYDLLASEARQTSLVAIAKKDVESKHWNNLGRTLTRLREHKGLVSWGGTAFEYLMPNINIPTYQSTLIDESCKLLVMSEKEYAKRLDIPWGMSEAAYSLKDFYGNYQYKTFGIPWLGLKRGLSDDAVISPYSSALALTITPRDAILNLKRLEKDGAVGKYGFYDSIDYKPKKEVVKTFMAHHQGMILASIDNVLNDNIFQKRFMNNPEIQGVKILLEENMPEDVIITKEKKDRAEKIRYDGYNALPPRKNGINIISSNELTNMVKEDGSGYTKLGDIIINEGVKIYIKNLNNNKIYDIQSILKNNKSKADNMIKVLSEFTSYSSKFTIEDGNINICIDTCLAPDSEVEIKKIRILNKGIQDVKLEVTTFEDIILSTKEQHQAHPTFDKMFLSYKYDDKRLIVTRKQRMENERIASIATSLYSEDQNDNLEFETDKENFISRNNINNDIPDAVQNSSAFSNNLETPINPIIAMRKIIEVKENDEKSLYLITSANYNTENAENNLKGYMNLEILKRVYELSKSQNEAQIRFMEIQEKDTLIYQQIIELLLYPIEKQLSLEENLEDKKLWKYGISGDYPILAVKIKERNDYYVVKEVLKAYEYMISKQIKLELVILANLNNDLYIDEKMNRYINVRGGIFILNNLKREEKKIIEERANLVIDTHNGALDVQVMDMYDNYKKNKNIEESNNEVNITNKLSNNKKKKETHISSNNHDILEVTTNYKKLNYENGIGTFNKDLTEYWIKENAQNKTPVAWSNIMANEKFGTVVTNSMGGYTWYINSRTNRLTKFKNDAYEDNSLEKIIVQVDKSDKEDELEDSYVCYGFGYSRFINSYSGIEQNLTIFVPTTDSAKVNILRLENKADEEKTIRIKYFVDWLIGEREDKSIISKKYKENLNMILVKNNINPHYYCYITSSEKINQNQEIIIKLKPYEIRDISIVLGAEKTELECIDVSTRYTNNYISELDKTIKHWNKLVRKVTSKTPLKSFDAMQNGYLVYQTIVSRMIAKTGFYQSSGGYGYRDQLQDALGMKWVDPKILKDQIILHSKHQFLEGDVEHWWHEDTSLGIRTRYSDDMLFLPYAVEEYIDFTGDYLILGEVTNYIKAKELTKNEKDRVDYYTNTSKSGTIFEHCLKAIKIAAKFGEHGLPLMKCGDWNDGMNKIGNEGKGESVWLGFFLYNILTRFIELIDYEKTHNKKVNISKEMSLALGDASFVQTHDIFSNKEEIAEEIGPTNIEELNKINYEETKEEFIDMANKLKKALNTVGWDGRWYRRAYDDNGKVIGSIENTECKIDSISQSFAVISNAGDNDKKYIAMTSLENYLLDDKNKLVRLLYPALEQENLGYITAYGKGMRENGGQYTHAAIWALIAEAMLNRSDEVMDIYKKINPVEHSLTKSDIMTYKVEPYVVEADIYSEGNKAGRGGWTWYTGSSSWLYEAQIRYILGINIYHGKMKIKPCVPHDWKDFNVKLNWKNATYNIQYKQTGKYSMSNEDKKVNEIELKDDGKHNVYVTF